MATPERKELNSITELDGCEIKKPTDGKGFEVPVFKDKPVVKPVVKTPLPTTKTGLEKP